MALVLTCGNCGQKLHTNEGATVEGQCFVCGGRLVIHPALSAISPQVPPEGTGQPCDQVGETITNHGGKKLPSDADFFVAAPLTIGPILTAYTSARQGKKKTSLGLWFLSCFGVGAVAALLAFLLLYFGFEVT